MSDMDRIKRKEFLKLEVEGKTLYLEGIELKGVLEFGVLKSSALPKGKAEVRMSLIVEFPDNKQEQNLLQAEKE